MASREQLMDYIDETYNTMELGGLLESTMEDMFGDQLLDAYGNWSDNGSDGMYSNLSKSDLQMLADKMDELSRKGSSSSYSAGEYTVTLKLSYSQLSTLKKALEDFSDPSFTKDYDMSRDAKIVLRQLEDI